MFTIEHTVEASLIQNDADVQAFSSEVTTLLLSFTRQAHTQLFVCDYSTIKSW